MKPFFIANLMEILSVYVIKRDFVTIRDLYGEMKIFPGKLRYNQRFAIAGYVINREYCIFRMNEMLSSPACAVCVASLLSEYSMYPLIRFETYDSSLAYLTHSNRVPSRVCSGRCS